jgi:DNA-binding PadR family transcriptional regulator
VDGSDVSATKLLVLGVARIFQPVHGYVVRRELLSWKVDQWANVKPGSIYGALRTLVKEGSLDEVGTESEGGRPARTTYRVNEDGEVEFFDLFRRNLWQNVDSTDLSGFRAALSFIWVARRDEVLQAMEHRINLLDGCLKEQRFGREQMAGIAEKPDHVVELYHLEEALLRGQLEWTQAFAERLRAGTYAFADEPGAGGVWHEALVEQGIVAVVPRGTPS